MLISILKELCKESHSVTVVQRVDDISKKTIPEELSDYSIEYKFVEIKTPPKGNFISRYLYELFYFIRSAKYLNKKYETIFVMSSNMGGVPIALAKFKNKRSRLIYNVQDIFPNNALYVGMIKSRGFIYNFLNTIQKFAYKKADRIITISEDMKETLVSNGATASKIDVVYNWSYGDCCYNQSITKNEKVSRMFSKSYFNVVYAGNLGIMQNVDVVIEAAKLLKDKEDVWFHIIGNGVRKEILIDQAKKYGINNITFYPMMDSCFAPTIYSSADVNIIPLAPNIYKTALPSKTAVCIACLKPIIFCFGNGSQFMDFVQRRSNCQNVESCDSMGLKEAILFVKQNPTTVGYQDLFQFFEATKNSLKYVEIITGKS